MGIYTGHIGAVLGREKGFNSFNGEIVKQCNRDGSFDWTMQFENIDWDRQKWEEKHYREKYSGLFGYRSGYIVLFRPNTNTKNFISGHENKYSLLSQVFTNSHLLLSNIIHLFV